MAGPRDTSDPLEEKYNPLLGFGKQRTPELHGLVVQSGPMVGALQETHLGLRQMFNDARKGGAKFFGGVRDFIEGTENVLGSVHSGTIKLREGAREAAQTIEETGKTIEDGVKRATSVASAFGDGYKFLTSTLPDALDAFNRTAQNLAQKEKTPLVAQNPTWKPDGPAP